MFLTSHSTSHVLPSCDIAAVHSLCTCLMTQEEDTEQAQEIATKAFSLANSHTNTCKPALSETLLQRLRDDFMTITLVSKASAMSQENAATVYSQDIKRNADKYVNSKSDPEKENSTNEMSADKSRQEADGAFDPTFNVQISSYALASVEKIRLQVLHMPP